MEEKINIKPSIKNYWKSILAIVVAYTIWTIVMIMLLIWFQGEEKTFKQFGSGSQFYLNLLYLIVKGSVVYYILIYQLAIPLTRNPKNVKVWLYSVLFFLLLTAYEYYFNYYVGFPDSAGHEGIPLHTFFLSAFFLDLMEVLVSIFIATLIISNEMRKHKVELEKEKLKAELAAVKYQINPHFLFNSLSFIYTKTIKTSPDAAHAVSLLSEIMSYALDEWDESGMVPLVMEIAQMKRVIEMNQIRFDHKLKIRYNEDIEANNTQVPIFTLVTLVENAFKHGELNDENHQVTIELEATADKIYFLLSNKKKKGPKEPSKGIGLNNVRQRLQMMYGIRHSFVIKEDENYYMSEITINL